MKSKSDWKFSAALREIDINRILEESLLSEPDASAVRFTVDGKVYTAVRTYEPELHITMGDDDLPPQAFRVRSETVFTRAEGKPALESRYDDEVTYGWVVFVGDKVGEVVDRVVVTVEVF